MPYYPLLVTLKSDRNSKFFNLLLLDCKLNTQVPVIKCKNTIHIHLGIAELPYTFLKILFPWFVSMHIL